MAYWELHKSCSLSCTSEEPTAPVNCRNLCQCVCIITHVQSKEIYSAVVRGGEDGVWELHKSCSLSCTSEEPTAPVNCRNLCQCVCIITHVQSKEIYSAVARGGEDGVLGAP